MLRQNILVGTNHIAKRKPIKTLHNNLLQFAFGNLFLVAVLGLLLRSSPFLPLPFTYENMLHGHSHFAFGGWAMSILIWMIIQYFPSIAQKISFSHWRNIIFLNLFSAYGMLASFPFEGYGVVSIIFSTLSVVAGYYLAIILWKASKKEEQNTGVRFLRAGLFYLALSAIGPFATGPLIAMGKQGSPIYFDTIYFYLHFQYNGWFAFTVLAVLYQIIERKGISKNGKKVATLFIISCLPAYFLSTLWNHPTAAFYVIGGIAALLQLISVFYLVKDFTQLKNEHSFLKIVMQLALLAFTVKNILQLLSAFPFFADMAYANRNFIIAYLHLALLGFVSLLAIVFVVNENQKILNVPFKRALFIFIVAFVLTELLLVLQACGSILNFLIPKFSMLLFVTTGMLPVSAFAMYWRIRRYCKFHQIIPQVNALSRS